MRPRPPSLILFSLDVIAHVALLLDLVGFRPVHRDHHQQIFFARRHVCMAAIVPFIFAMILGLLAMFFAYDEPHRPGWPVLGAGVFFVKLLIPCLITAAICEWRKARQS